MSGRIDFKVEAVEGIVVKGPDSITGWALMSPYCWRLGERRVAMLVRVVPPPGHEPQHTGAIWYGESEDGLSFALEDAPVIAPGPGAADIGGCEDPTMVLDDDGGMLVYYTGVDASRSSGQMLVAQGPDVHHLAKTGVALAASRSEGNTKEATIDRTADRRWRLFYEYARDQASLIGLAVGDGPTGPWREQPAPFGPREGRWDGWHLSTGPLLTDDRDCPVMFYNGATRDARWRIGWVAFDRDYTRVVDRSVEPMIVPAPQPERGMIDIAFAASVITDADTCLLYYSRSDAILERARIRRFRG